jgi:hypothetical protein
VLVECGAQAGEECSTVDKRLLDTSNDNSYLWKAVNFAASGPSLSAVSRTSQSQDAGAQREQLITFLLSLPDALPTFEAASVDLRVKIYRMHPSLLPVLLEKIDSVWQTTDSREAKTLYHKVRRCDENTADLY